MPARPQGLFSCSPLSLCRNLSPLWRQVGSALRGSPRGPGPLSGKTKLGVFFGDRPLRLNCPFRVYLRALFWMACVDSLPLFPCSCLLSWNKSFRKVFRRLSLLQPFQRPDQGCAHVSYPTAPWRCFWETLPRSLLSYCRGNSGGDAGDPVGLRISLARSSMAKRGLLLSSSHNKHGTRALLVFL